MPTVFSGRMVPLNLNSMWEPPYARILRRLGLFDPLVLPAQSESGTNRNRAGVNMGTGRSTFPVVAYSGGNVVRQQPWDGQGVSPDIGPDSGHLMGTIGEIFGDTTRWAVGNLFGQLRDAMDYIESNVDRNVQHEQNQQNSQSLFRALRSDLISNFDRLFPEPSDGEKSDCRYYHVSTYTLPDGSIETRKVIHNKDGSETTTIIQRNPSSSTDDEVTTTITVGPDGRIESNASSTSSDQK
ncbi:hypothetical protein GGI05_000213 [Coemansia sp. RSA 2603]|nr:hypothetical protein GGI05_000213 [Coemansia sp. RSA 2603]